MAKISLRAYCDEVKELIRANSHEEAIAICQHILRHHPKHMETYRLLGEACVELGRYREAGDFFRRVLSADPEDFIAHVGLSIIYEDQEALDEAIWQMEHAFELNPSNAEIRKDLQRLYGRRDGLEKARVKLTPGALGRLYVKGGLLSQAIAEFKALLEKDAELLDIQVALAEALWLNEQQMETIEVCQDILKVLPNCLKANLILGEIWLRSNRQEEAEAHLHVAQALDPDNALAQKFMGDRSPLPPTTVEIPRLEEVIEAEAPIPAEEMEEISPEPIVGVPAAEDAPVEAAVEGEGPDWLQQLREAEVEEAPAAEAPTEVEELEGVEIPDWLRELKPTEVAEVPEAPVGEVEERVEVEEEEMPAWMRIMKEEGMEEELIEALEAAAEAPEELAAEEMAPLEEAPPEVVVEEEEIPEWLRRLREVEIEEAPAAEAPTEVEELEEVEIPDWLRELKPTEVAEVPEAPVAEVEERVEVEEEEIPAWMRIMKEEVMKEELIEALEAAAEAPEELAAEEMAPLEEAPPGVVVEEEEIPEWLRQLREAEIEEALAAEVPTEVEELEEAEIPAWLRELKPTEVAEVPEAPVSEVEIKAEEIAPPPLEEREEVALPPEIGPPEVPDWLLRLRREISEELMPGEELELEAARDRFAEVPTEEPAMEEMAPFEAKPVMEEEEEIPDWLRELKREVEAEALKEEEIEVAAPEVEEELPVAEEAEAPIPLAEQLFEEAIPAAIEEREEVPEWLQQLQRELPPEEVAAVEEVGIPIAAEVPEEALAPTEEEAVEWPISEAVEEVPIEEALEAPVPEALEEMVAVPVEEAVEVVEAPSIIEVYEARLASQPSDHQARLDLARAYAEAGEREAALKQYEKLILSGELLDAVIEDLEATTLEAPDDPKTYHLLGDAYMKDNRLQQALEAYKEAMSRLS